MKSISLWLVCFILITIINGQVLPYAIEVYSKDYVAHPKEAIRI